MKTYTKRQFSGNANGWTDPKEVGIVALDDNVAEDLNAQFCNSGIDYVPVDGVAVEPVVEAPAEAEAALAVEAEPVADTPQV